jgi:SAM-dependent methyltransferase
MSSRHPIPIAARVPPYEELRVARGCLEVMEPTADDSIKLEGWVLAPYDVFDRLEVFVDGQNVGTIEMLDRRDVADTFPWIRHALRSGFRLNVARGRLPLEVIHHLEIVGHAGGKPLGRFHSLLRADLYEITPTPPGDLMVRVAGHDDAPSFKLGGLKCFGEFHEAIERFRGSTRGLRILDWGCGCGRVAVHFLMDPERPAIDGCDVDAEAVAWCQSNLAGGEFRVSGLWPKTPYADDTFDVILGYSVFTHLAKDAQKIWLDELKRILAPGGLLMATVHGPFALAFECTPETAELALRAESFHENADDSLGEIADAEYYRNSFQSREYTMREWSKHLEIVEYVEAGLNSYQDLIVMRKVASSQ